MMNMASPHFTTDIPDRGSIGQGLGELRSAYGAQDWLTVVGAAVGNAYRLAGVAAGEFAALLRAHTAERDRLLIHLRRKPIMRLRTGFDGSTGGLCDEDGLVSANVHFGAGHYAERDGLVTASGPFPSALLVTGPLNRPLGRILPKAPRCLAGLRVRSLRQGRWGMEFEVADGFETLASMPDAVADELGIDRQRHLGHIPWLGYEGAAPAVAEAPTAAPACVASARRGPARATPGPRLRLVASS